MNKRLTRHLSVQVEGLNIFYREAGSNDAPVILLLHGYPSSSHMFRDLLPLLADRFRLIAPDYPGFGFSAVPKVDEFDYTFDRLADVIESFTEKLGLVRYSLYMQDFGGPVGFRLAVRHPERVAALIIQNANAYDEGMSSTMRSLVLPLWPKASPEAVSKALPIFELPNTKRQFLEGVPDPALVSPEAWQLSQWSLDRPGMKDVALALHVDYGSNLGKYPEWQAYFHRYQPPTLIAWGKGDFVFTVEGAEAYQRDLRQIETHILDTGHFALETHAREIANLIREFRF